MPKPKLPGVLKNLLPSRNKSGNKETKSKDSTNTDGADDTCDMTMSSLRCREDAPSGPESLVPMLHHSHVNEPRSQPDGSEGYGSPDESKKSSSACASRQACGLMAGQSGQRGTRGGQHDTGDGSDPQNRLSSSMATPPHSGDYDSRTEPKQMQGDYDSRTEPKQLQGAEEGRGKINPSMTSDYATMTPTSSLVPETPPTSGSGLGDAQPPSLANSLENKARDLVETVSRQNPTVIERPLNQGPTVCIEHSRGAGVAVSPAGREHTSAPVAPARNSKSKKPKGPSHHSAPVAGVVGGAMGGGGGGASESSSTSIIRLFPDLPSGDSDGELFPDSALSTPVGALRKSRKRLCLMLNIEQPQVDTDYPPDYTGLAEMLGFDAIEIQNFWDKNPADTLFMEWARCQDSTLLPPVLKTLVECLVSLGRQDILQDCRGMILEDVRDYIAEQHLLKRYTVDRLQKFDCYVNIAEQDLLTTGREILDTLEGVYKLRLCLTLRDVTLGGCPYERMAEMLETRCDSKVVIVLTKSYENSDACQFLTQFAVSLDPGSRRNKLIPLLVDEDTYIPRVLRMLAMLNYHRDKRLGFLWPRLKHAISQ